jgi:hypothetical protein
MISNKQLGVNFVSFKIAKLLKKLNIILPHYAWYNEAQLLIVNSDEPEYETISMSIHDIVNKSPENPIGAYPCPLLQTLVDWLEIEHNIHIVPTPNIGNKNGYDSFPIVGWKSDVLIPNLDNKEAYYMGYPVLVWSTLEDLKDERNNGMENLSLKDIGFQNFKTKNEAIEFGCSHALNIIKRRNERQK